MVNQQREAVSAAFHPCPHIEVRIPASLPERLDPSLLRRLAWFYQPIITQLQAKGAGLVELTGLRSWAHFPWRKI